MHNRRSQETMDDSDHSHSVTSPHSVVGIRSTSVFIPSTNHSPPPLATHCSSLAGRASDHDLVPGIKDTPEPGSTWTIVRGSS